MQPTPCSEGSTAITPAVQVATEATWACSPPSCRDAGFLASNEWPGLFSSKAQAGSLAPRPLPHPLQGPPFLQNAPCSALEALHTQSSMGTEDFRDGKQILHLRVKALEAPLGKVTKNK